MEKLQYPIGRFSEPIEYTNKIRLECIEILKNAPKEFADLIYSLTSEELHTPYRDGGWTPKQIIHHVADSHMNSIIRIKLALTEDNPTIKPYDENAWITLSDSNIDVESSIEILKGVHKRYVNLIESLTEDQFKRTIYHPESNISMSVDYLVALYAWHSKHHLGHIKIIRDMKNINKLSN